MDNNMFQYYTYQLAGDLQMAEQPASNQVNAPSDTSSTAKKRTPPNIEALLRGYNKEGITKWNEILDRLKKEVPPIRINRSTLGEYLKECSIGTSRRKNMTDDKMKAIVLHELDQTRSRNRGVRKVWENLKSCGHHIKRDFVEMIMREVNSEGFSKRRPKWKSLLAMEPAAGLGLQLLPNSESLATSAASMSSNQNALCLPQPPNTQMASTRFVMQAQASVSVTHSSRATIDATPPAPGPRAFSGATMSAFSTSTTAPGTWNTVELRGDIGGEEKEHGWREFNDVPVNYPMESSGETGPRSHDSKVDSATRGDIPAVASSLLAPGASAKHFERGGEVQDEDTASKNASMLNAGAEISDDEFEPPDSPAPVPDRTFWEALSTADREEQESQVLRLQLQRTIDGLLVQLTCWCAAPLEDTPSKASGLSDFPMSAARDPSNNELDGEHRSKRYAPNYDLPEDEVAKEALSLAWMLQRTLTHPKSRGNVAEVARQLTDVRGRLQDIGMLPNCLAKVGMKHLNVMEAVSHAYGQKTWVLEDMWQCAADCVEELYGADFNYSKLSRTVARKAAAAARCLSSTGSIHPNIHDAISLHYGSVALHYGPVALSERDDEVAYDMLQQSIDHFAHALPPNPPNAYLREMMRAISTLIVFLSYEDGEAKIVFGRILLHAHSISSDPGLAVLLGDIIGSMFDCWEGRDKDDGPPDGLWDEALSLSRISVDALRSFQHARPYRAQRALVRTLCALQQGFHSSRRYMEAIQALEEAITIQHRLVTFDADEVSYLGTIMSSYLENQLCLRRWRDALDTINRLAELVESTPHNNFTHTLCRCFHHFRDHLESKMDPQVLSVVCSVMVTLSHTLGSCGPGRHLDIFMRVMLSISGLQRGLGEFEAALDTSRAALAVARQRRRIDEEEDSMTGMLKIESLACHARCLVDNDAYGEALALFQEGKLTWESNPDLRSTDHLPYPPYEFALFDIVHAHLPWVVGDALDIDEIIPSFSPSSSNSNIPSSVYPNNYSLCYTMDGHAWLLLIRTLRRCVNSSEQASTSAKESLSAITEYYERTRMDMEPYAKASVLGHRFILLNILGKREEGVTVLDEMVRLYRSVIATVPQMARLPLLIFLDILLVLSRGPYTLRFTTATLQGWKKSVYQGSMSFFDNFVAFLKELLPFH